MGAIEKKRKPTLAAQREKVRLAEAKAAAAREELNQSFQEVMSEYNAVFADLARALLELGGADSAYLQKRAGEIFGSKPLKTFKKAVLFFGKDGE